MRKFLAIVAVLSITIACSSDPLVGKEYNCVKSNEKAGATLRFKKGGKVFLDLIAKDIVERNPNLASKNNVAGEYEIVGDEIIVKYFNGFQTHTLSIIGDKLTSNTEIFKLCTCTK